MKSVLGLYIKHHLADQVDHPVALVDQVDQVVVQVYQVVQVDQADLAVEVVEVPVAHPVHFPVLTYVFQEQAIQM